MSDQSKWLLRIRSNPNARIRLFCFPYAGAGASVFSNWPARLPDWAEIFAVQYPGRETRWREAPISSAEELGKGILTGIKDLLREIPYAFFGHSLGALVSFEVARLAHAARLPEPRRLVLSGRRAPHSTPYPPEMHALSDQAFLENLGKLNGTPAAVLENAEMMALLLPMLRADFTLDESYTFESGPMLWQDFSIYGGGDDFRVPEGELRAWSAYTTGAHSFQLFPGDHFYLKDPSCGMFEVLAGELDSL